jgi:hypothetical protein
MPDGERSALPEDRSTTGLSSGPDVVADQEQTEAIKIQMDKRIDLVLSLLWVAFGIMTVYIATGFRIGGYPDPVTARGLPYFTGSYLVVAGIVLAARRVMTWSQIPGRYAVSEGREDEPGYPASWPRSFAIVALAALWAYSLRYAGFILATPVMIFAALWLMEVRSLTKLILFPLLFSFLSWLIFSQVLGVILPMGILSPWARSWGLLP